MRVARGQTMSARMSIHMPTRMPIHMSIQVYTYFYTQVYTYVYTQVYTYVYTQVYTQLYTYVYTQVGAHIYTPVYTHTHVYLPAVGCSHDIGSGAERSCARTDSAVPAERQSWPWRPTAQTLSSSHTDSCMIGGDARGTAKSEMRCRWSLSAPRSAIADGACQPLDLPSPTVFSAFEVGHVGQLCVSHAQPKK